MGCALQQTLKPDNPFDMSCELKAPSSWPLLLLARRRHRRFGRYQGESGRDADIAPRPPLTPFRT
jgi:hypothetical protein